MSKTKKAALSNPVMIRMDPTMKRELESVAKANDLSTSDIVRLAVSRQLPFLKSGRTSLNAS